MAERQNAFHDHSHEWAYAADPGFVDASYKQQMSLIYPEKKFVNRSSIWPTFWRSTEIPIVPTAYCGFSIWSRGTARCTIS